MASCKFCLTGTSETWFGSWCKDCHKLQRMIALFGVDKIMSIVETVLIVDDSTQDDKIKEELKTELSQREICNGFSILPFSVINFLLPTLHE